MTKDPENQQLAAFGAHLRSLREARGLNLHELARLSGISAPALSLIETGKRDLRLTSLYRIAAALRIPPGDLVEARGSASRDTPAKTRGGYDLGDYR